MQKPAQMHIIEEEINKENIELLKKYGFEYLKNIKRPTKSVIQFAEKLKIDSKDN